MYKLLIVAFAFVLVSCDEVTYFIIRHAEKATASMANDPALTEEGEKQATDLKYFLQGSKVKRVFSTNYTRTLSTAEPSRVFFGVPVEIYDPRKMDSLVTQLKQIKEGDVLIVGHSNTVDDVVNGLLGEKKLEDLPETEYGMVYIIRKRGNSFSYEKMALPKTTPR